MALRVEAGKDQGAKRVFGWTGQTRGIKLFASTCSPHMLAYGQYKRVLEY